MPVPSYLTDQNEDYIKAKGQSFKNFSPEQILDELRMRDIRLSLHGHKALRDTYFKDVEGKKVKTKYTTIVDDVPQLGASTRWAILKNPFTSTVYRCVRLKRGIKKNIDFRKNKRGFRCKRR